KPSSATTSPSSTRLRTPSVSETSSAIASELERVARASLHGDPAQLGELVDHCLPAEAAPARVLDAAERHLRLIAHRPVVDVHGPRLDLLRKREAAVGVRGEDARAQAVARRVRACNRVLRAVRDLDGD